MMILKSLSTSLRSLRGFQHHAYPLTITGRENAAFHITSQQLLSTQTSAATDQSISTVPMDINFLKGTVGIVVGAGLLIFGLVGAFATPYMLVPPRMAALDDEVANTRKLFNGLDEQFRERDIKLEKLHNQIENVMESVLKEIRTAMDALDHKVDGQDRKIEGALAKNWWQYLCSRQANGPCNKK